MSSAKGGLRVLGLFSVFVAFIQLAGSQSLPYEDPGVTLHAVEEKASHNSWWWNSSAQTVQQRPTHLLRLKFKIAIPQAPVGIPGATITRRTGVLVPGELGTEHTGIEQWNAPLAPSGSALILEWPQAQTFYYAHLATLPTTALNSGSVTLYVGDKIEYLDNGQPKILYRRWLVPFSIVKVPCSTGDASVDSRWGYPGANDVGALFGVNAGVNSAPRNLNFGNSQYRGGLFAGNMYWGATSDQSGVARIQLWPEWQGNESDVAFAALSLLSKGPRSNSPASELGLYAPTVTDPNQNSTESGVVWTSRWTSVSPRPRPQSGPLSPWLDWLDKRTESPMDEYMTWGLTQVGPPFVNPGEFWTPTEGLKKLCIAMTAETEVFNQTSNLYQTSVWNYFASKEHQASHPTRFPDLDGAPRLWVVLKPATPMDYEWWQVQ